MQVISIAGVIRRLDAAPLTYQEPPPDRRPRLQGNCREGPYEADFLLGLKPAPKPSLRDQLPNQTTDRASCIDGGALTITPGSYRVGARPDA